MYYYILDMLVLSYLFKTYLGILWIFEKYLGVLWKYLLRGILSTCSFQTFIPVGLMGTDCNIGLTFCWHVRVCVCIRDGEQAVPCWSQCCSVLHLSWGIVCDHPLISCRHKHVQTHTYEHNTNMEILSRLLWVGVRQGFMYFHS